MLGSIDHQLSVTGDEAVSEASDVDEPVNVEGVCYLTSVCTVVLYVCCSVASMCTHRYAHSLHKYFRTCSCITE